MGSIFTALAVAACADPSSGEDGDGTGSMSGEESSGNPAPASACPDCAGVCLESQCVDPPSPVTLIDPDASLIVRVDGGIAYLKESAIGFSDRAWVQPFGGAAEVLYDPGADRSVTDMWPLPGAVMFVLSSPYAVVVVDTATGSVTEWPDLGATNIILLLAADPEQIVFRDYEYVYRFTNDGTLTTLTAGNLESAAVSEDAIWVMERMGAMGGVVAAYELDGTGRREVGTWAGTFPWIGVRGTRVVWKTSEVAGVGEDVLRTLVDTGDANVTPEVMPCEGNIAARVLRDDAMVYFTTFSSELYECRYDGTGSTVAWEQTDQYRGRLFVRGDDSLVAFENLDDEMTLYRLTWP